MREREGHGHDRRRRQRANRRVAGLAFALLLTGAVLTGTQLVLLGVMTPPVIALDTVGATLLPLGIVSLIGRTDPPGRGPGEEEDGGGGGGGGSNDEPEPLFPSGGLSIDWNRFEAEFRAYARAVELETVGSA